MQLSGKVHSRGNMFNSQMLQDISLFHKHLENLWDPPSLQVSVYLNFYTELSNRSVKLTTANQFQV
jgi:hypothetical protein